LHEEGRKFGFFWSGREKKSWEKEEKSTKIFRSSHKIQKKTLEMWKDFVMRFVWLEDFVEFCCEIFRVDEVD
jgi:hypothetical protein